MHRINIATQFSPTPGARYKTDGPASGEEFRERFLEPLFADANDQSEIEIVLDGAAGFATSFLEETFGGLARRFPPERCLARLRFVSNEDPMVVEEITEYIQNARQ